MYHQSLIHELQHLWSSFLKWSPRDTVAIFEDLPNQTKMEICFLGTLLPRVALMPRTMPSPLKERSKQHYTSIMLLSSDPINQQHSLLDIITTIHAKTLVKYRGYTNQMVCSHTVHSYLSNVWQSILMICCNKIVESEVCQHCGCELC